MKQRSEFKKLSLGSGDPSGDSHMIEISYSRNLSVSEKEAQFKTEKPKRLGIDDFRKLGLLSEKGKIRLLQAQRYFENNEVYFPTLLDLFEAWKNDSEYVVLRNLEMNTILALKCSKRGNDVYNARIKRRFAFLFKNSKDLRFFSPEDFTSDHQVKTSILWVTLSWNTKRSCGIRKAWRCEISQDWNRFISALRRRYGKIHVLRSYEATRNGYPHVHAIMVFEDQEFSVFPHLNNENKLTYRIQEKTEFESLWHSWVDIEAFPSMKKVCYYALKYQLKVNEGREEEQGEAPKYSSKTLAFMWLFRKRSYAVSGSFREIFSRLDVGLHNSNMENREIWEFLGVFSGSQLGLDGQWFSFVDPERLKGLLPDGDFRVDERICNVS